MKILFAGGGTAGHINPALAIADYIKLNHPDAEIYYIGTPDKLEAKLVPEKGYAFYPVKVSGFSRKLNIKGIAHNINAAKLAVTSNVKAKKLLKEIKPDLVVGTGGYVSGPVLKAAQQLKIKTAIHEQNAFPGVTTKMLAPKADRVMLAMPEAEKYLKLNKKPIITGNPIRRELLTMDKATARKILKLDNRPLILSFGGSLGAKHLNESVCELIKWHNPTENYYHIHATGKLGYSDMLKNLEDVKLHSGIEIREYITDMDVCMAAADLVISRAGAITLGEIQACGKAAVLIPSPFVAENHQYHNGMTLKNAGAAELIEEKDLTKEKIINTVKELLADKEKITLMEKASRENAIIDANERIYAVLMDLYNKS
ncbi:MAG: undecaprenyldiphospho-muramoylpentapeptide beta-N-acetylglucosaminyltransferase [Clostridia bacterium]|nr:undecaprenyldiphospho-muramoylpentapeptide beta-N-acetylglucosaminyltransferase [Clostridia bacterium]